MQPTKGNKKLYHIQSVTGWGDEPYDIFVWSVNEPIEAEVKELYIKDRGNPEYISDDEVQDFLENYNIYSVYAEEV